MGKIPLVVVPIPTGSYLILKGFYASRRPGDPSLDPPEPSGRRTDVHRSVVHRASRMSLPSEVGRQGLAGGAGGGHTR